MEKPKDRKCIETEREANEIWQEVLYEKVSPINHMKPCYLWMKSKIKEALNKNVKDVHLLWPIPKVEIDNNPDMKPADQNPGY